MTDNDLISRKKLIDDLEAWRKLLDRRVSRFDDMVIHTLPVVFDLVNEQKAVKADKAKWISVKERLPEHEVDVLLYDDGNVFVGYLAPCSSDLYVYADGCLYNVTHWMPLPEPPKEE